MSQSATGNGTEPDSEREHLPQIFIGIIAVEVVTIVVLYYIGVYFA